MRTPFFDDAHKLMQMISDDEVQAYVTANSITDIVYITRKDYTPVEIRSAILDLLDSVDVVGVTREDILSAFALEFRDFEDALQSTCSQKEGMDYIVTRNKKDFTGSRVVAVDLTSFLTKHYVENED